MKLFVFFKPTGNLAWEVGNYIHNKEVYPFRHLLLRYFLNSEVFNLETELFGILVTVFTPKLDLVEDMKPFYGSQKLITIHLT